MLTYTKPVPSVIQRMVRNSQHFDSREGVAIRKQRRLIKFFSFESDSTRASQQTSR
jgi:hypothetical protein